MLLCVYIVRIVVDIECKVKSIREHSPAVANAGHVPRGYREIEKLLETSDRKWNLTRTLALNWSMGTIATISARASSSIGLVSGYSLKFID